MYLGNRNKNILVIGEGSTRRLDDSTITVEVKYPISFKVLQKKNVLSLHCSESNSFLFFKKQNYVNQTKDSKIESDPVSLDNISKDLQLITWKKTGVARKCSWFFFWLYYWY